MGKEGTELQALLEALAGERSFATLVDEELPALIHEAKREPGAGESPGKSPDMALAEAIRETELEVRPALEALAKYRQVKALHGVLASEHKRGDLGADIRVLLEIEVRRLNKLQQDRRATFQAKFNEEDMRAKVRRLDLLRLIRESNTAS